MNQDLLNALEEIAGKDNILTNEPMKKHTTFRIGGPAKVFVKVESEKQIADVISCIRQYGEKYYIVGNGSNLLVSDNGFDGVIIQLADKYSSYSFLEKDNESEEGKTEVYVESGMNLIRLAKILSDKSLTGFEFASGIPGTIGGAVMMNAGAYGGEIKDCVVSVRALDKDLKILDIPCEEMEFEYRNSRASRENLIVLGALLKFTPGNRENIESTMKELAARRIEKQPLEYPSAGSTFKRPVGHFAGKLIEDAGLKGYCVGGACVSTKHSGFVVNTGNATAKDVHQLTENVIEKVRDMFGVTLELEIKELG